VQRETDDANDPNTNPTRPYSFEQEG
jgi:hypothetical protein